MGFLLWEAGERICDVEYADNVLLFAENVADWEAMVSELSDELYNRYGWRWKPSSMEVLIINGNFDHEYHDVVTFNGILRYRVQESIVSLGGKFSATDLSKTFLEYRLAQADKSLFKGLRVLRSDAPIKLKLEAYAGTPRATAVFNLGILHWNKTMVQRAMSFERRSVRRILNM